MSELTIKPVTPESDVGAVPYALISPRQFYNRINRELDEPIGLTTVYQLVKQKDFPSIKIGGRFFVIENKVEEWLQSLTGKRKQ